MIEAAPSCNAVGENRQLQIVSTHARSPQGSAKSQDRHLRSEFGDVYRTNLPAVTGFFARRATEPQTVADLTSETFVEAIGSFGSFDVTKGSPRAWLFGIARAVYAQHCARTANGHEIAVRLAGQMTLGDDDLGDLVERIDAQHAGRDLLRRCALLPELERAAIELVDLEGLTPKEAATALHVSPGAVRVRLFRARSRLRKEAGSHEQL
jgi:RNA polymerase sigma factor (sigma-70 family)